MSVFGIVSEFNPFHFGHEYLIRCARQMGAGAVVCAMSGNATQRGELAITDKYTRAQAALKGGADLVLELPFPWSSASAESFSLAGIHVLSSFCDTVIFGSECGDIDLLSRVAQYTCSQKFKEEYSSCLSNGEQSATAYLSLIKNRCGAMLSSNDLLGVEYIKAAKTLGLDLNFVTVKRQGSAYRCDEISDGQYDSAMAIRGAVRDGESLEFLKERLPNDSYELLKKAVTNGEITDTQKYGEVAMMYYRLFDGIDDECFAECDGGVLERIVNVANESATADDFFKGLSTKRYTDAKLRRAVLFGLCKVCREDVFVPSLPSYTLLLAANAKGRELLSGTRRAERITVVTKPADVSLLLDDRSKRQAFLSRKLDKIHGFCLKNPVCAGSYITKKPYIT